MSKKFVVNDTLENFSESFEEFLKEKYGYKDELAKNISETAMNLASFYGVEYLQGICDAISSCKYSIKAEKGMFPEYKSEFNSSSGEIKREITLPINSDIDSPYAREYILMPTIKLVNSYNNEYIKEGKNLIRRSGIMKENVETKEKSGLSLEEEFEKYAHIKIVKKILAPEEQAKIEPIDKNIKPISAFLLLDGSLGLDEITRKSILSGDDTLLKEEFDAIFGENSYDYLKENSKDMNQDDILESYVEAVSQMQIKKPSKTY